METKTKLMIAREVIIFLVTIAIGLIVYGIGDMADHKVLQKIGIFLLMFGYILFYLIFKLAILWFKRCNRYPL